MKKIVFILVFIAGLTAGVHTASAQYCMDYGTISRKGADLYSGETKLSAEEVCSLLAETAEIPYSYYESTRKGFNAGKGMLIQITYNLFSMMMDINDQFVKAGFYQSCNNVFQHGASCYWYQSFGTVVGQRA